MPIEMRAETVAQAYDRWAPVYDLVFGSVFRTGRAQACAAANRIGGRILEAGVGTGISLPLYRADCRLFGIDISESMLERAKARARSLS
ncbi:MAG: methyltransferase domain-containing protein, partial [Novosphingobium sp.]|nr:methyltransferase domain-containing protein [Novosphingobium sp.]